MILYGGSPYPVSATPTEFAPQIGQFPPYEIKSKYSQQTKQKCAFHPVSARAKFTMPRLGDAVQRWLRHPEPSSWSHKSTIKEKISFILFGKAKRTQKDKLFSCFSWQKSISRFRQTECIQAHARIH